MQEYPNVKAGSKGEHVVILQQGLVSGGFLLDKADGIYGPKTGKALRRFQKSQGLADDGVAGKNTWAALVGLNLVPPPPAQQSPAVMVRFASSAGVEAVKAEDDTFQLVIGSGDANGFQAVADQLGIVAATPVLEMPPDAQALLDRIASDQGAEPPRFGDFVFLHFAPGTDLETVATQLKALPDVVDAAPAYPPRLTATTNDPLLGASDQVTSGQSPPNQWYIFRCRADRAWDMATGAGVLIGVVDSGFTLDHEDLVGNIDLSKALDVPSGTPKIPLPSIDHGTNVTGFAAADGNNGKGVAGFAHEATVVPVQWAAVGGSHASEIAVGILHVLFIPGPARKVINLSAALGITGVGDVPLERDPLIAEMIRLAGLANVPVVISAGNTTRDAGLDGAGNPIPDSGSIMVTATAYDPAANPPLPGTAFGARVDVCAPGDWAHDTTCANPAAGTGGKPYRTMGMTSGAVPKVAGTVALMLSANPELPAAEVREILRRTGSAPAALPGQPIGAFLDAAAAVGEAMHRRLLVTASQPDWRWCNKCQHLHYGGVPGAPCAAGGAHDPQGSGNYVIPMGAPASFGQNGWRWCNKCQGMHFGGHPQLACAAGGTHDSTGSGDYSLDHGGSAAFAQADWAWCNKCSGLSYTGGGVGPCPAGGTHDVSGSGRYVLKMT